MLAIKKNFVYILGFKQGVFKLLVGIIVYVCYKTSMNVLPKPDISFIDREVFSSKPYQLKRCDNKRVQMVISPSIREKASVVYAFENMANGKSLVGYTTNLIGRIYKYISDANNLEISSPFYMDLRAHPENFVFRVLKKVPSSQSALLPALETKYIAEYDSFKNGYNQNKGGGGSASQGNVVEEKSPDRNQVLKTPEKSYPFVEADGKIKVLTSPGLRTQGKFIYTIFDTKKTMEGRTRHYIGSTGQKPNKRLAQHLTIFNRKKNRRGGPKLVREVTQDPTRFRFGILLRLKLNESLQKAERFAIQQKEATVIGLNHNKGGGGGCIQ